MFDFFFGIHLSAIIPPNILAKEGRKIFSSHSSFSGQLSFKIAKESFPPINIVFALSILFLLVLNRLMDIASSCQSGIGSSSVQAQILIPDLTFLVVIGIRSLASVSSTNSANTFPFLARIPKTGCLVVPKPPVCSLKNLTLRETI